MDAKKELSARQRQLNSVDDIMQSYRDEISKLEVHQQDMLRRDLTAIRTAADDLKLAHSVSKAALSSAQYARLALPLTCWVADIDAAGRTKRSSVPK